MMVHLFTMPLRPEKTSASPHQLEKTLSFLESAEKSCQVLVLFELTSQFGFKYVQLVGGIPTPLKNDGVRQLGLLFPTEWKTINSCSKPPTSIG